MVDKQRTELATLYQQSQQSALEQSAAWRDVFKKSPVAEAPSPKEGAEPIIAPSLQEYEDKINSQQQLAEQKLLEEQERQRARMKEVEEERRLLEAEKQAQLEQSLEYSLHRPPTAGQSGLNGAIQGRVYQGERDQHGRSPTMAGYADQRTVHFQGLPPHMAQQGWQQSQHQE